MQSRILPLLCCPGGAGETCGGCLLPDERGPLSPVYQEGDDSDWLEGSLRCLTCGVCYPILSGVAILVPAPDEYIQSHHASLKRDLTRHGRLSPAAGGWLDGMAGRREAKEYGADFRFSQQFERPWDVAQAMADQPQELYGPAADWLRAISDEGPSDILAGWARERLRPGALVVDAGCGGGGLLSRMAGAGRTLLGADWSFLAVLLARKALLHRPEPLRSYLLSRKCGEEVERPLGIGLLPGSEVVVGDCRRPPFPRELFDVAFSSNIIDVAGFQPTLNGTASLVRPGGSLLLTDPFFFPEGEAPPGEPRAAVRSALEALGFEITKERDGVAWAWPIYDRHWRFFFNYCVAATRIPTVSA